MNSISGGEQFWPMADEIEARDVTMMAQLACQLGSIRAASDFIFNATIVREYTLDFESLVDNWMAFKVGQWRLDNVSPELYLLSEDDYAERCRQDAAGYFSMEITDADMNLNKALDELAERDDTATAYELLGALGIEKTEEGFSFIEKDEQRAAALERLAMLMDDDYRGFAARYPELINMIDFKIAVELEGKETENPVIRQLLRELGSEPT